MNAQRLRRFILSTVVIGLGVFVLSVAVTSTAFAGHGSYGNHGGGSGSGGSIALVMVNDVNGNGIPNLGDKVTFAVQTMSTWYPWVTVLCYQNGTLVSRQSNGIFSISLEQNFTLGPTPAWQSGAASCTATLENWDSYSKNGRIVPLTSITFQVEP